jgi:hypothetical protein
MLRCTQGGTSQRNGSTGCSWDRASSDDAVQITYLVILIQTDQLSVPLQWIRVVCGEYYCMCQVSTTEPSTLRPKRVAAGRVLERFPE